MPDSATRSGGQASLEAHLELIAEMAEDFAGSLDVDVTLARALERITRHLDAEAGSIFLLEPDGEHIVCRASTGPVDLAGLRLRRDEGVVGRAVRCNACELVRDVLQDPNFEASVDRETGFTTRSILCASLSVRDHSLGAIELINKRGGEGLFGDPDRRVLRTLAAAAGLAIQNARLAASLVEQERVRRELELAAEIQRSLLPARRPPPFPVFGANSPARAVSGDFYEFLELGDGRIGFSIGDVSGKGINAALLMAKTASLYRCLAKSGASPGVLLGRINEEICENATRGMFVTMVVGDYDPASGRVRLANAGHEPALVHRSDGSFESLPAEAPPVGIAPDVAAGGVFPETELVLADAALYLFTDGLTEALVDGSPLGAEGVRELIAKNEALAPDARVDALLAPLAGGLQHDDLTVVLVEPRGSGGAALSDAGEDAEKLLEIAIPARASRLAEVRRAVERAARAGGCSAACARDVVMAVDEACQNVIRHAYGGECDDPIELEILRDGDRLVLRLRDHAPPVDPARVRPRDLDDVRPGGLGVHFIREVMDDARFLPRPAGGGNLLQMIKRIG